MWSKTIREFCNSIKVINACAATTPGGGGQYALFNGSAEEHCIREIIRHHLAIVSGYVCDTRCWTLARRNSDRPGRSR